jgi:hypothetical protein
VKLTIDRKRWLRGDRDSALLRPDGKMCCLGFLGLACGLTTADIYDIASPASVLNREKFPEFLFKPDAQSEAIYMFNSGIAKQLMNINDLLELTDSEREAQLRDIFDLHGIEVEFVD